MTLRARLEAVAQTYLRQIEIRCGHHECCRCQINPLFLDALVQAVGEWKTEAELQTVTQFHRGKDSPQPYEERVIALLMAWAQGQPPEPTPSPTDPRPVAGRCPAGHPIHWLPCRCCASCACGYGWGSSHAPRPAAG